jgi:hypothetical protein
MDLKQKTQLRQLETGRRRGWITYLLYENRPTPISFNMLWQILDARNMPLTCRQFADKLDYLRSIGYIRIFQEGDGELDRAAQAKLIQKYCDHDGEGGDHYFASLSADGVKFQEGHLEDSGVSRVS